MTAQTEKQRALAALAALPEDATLGDAIERLLFIAKVEEGLRQSESGMLFPHENRVEPGDPKKIVRGIPDDHALALGRLVSAWSCLEHSIKSLLCAACGIRSLEDSAILVEWMNASTAIQLLRSAMDSKFRRPEALLALPELPAAIHSQVVAICKRAEAVLQVRNHFAHSIWWRIPALGLQPYTQRYRRNRPRAEVAPAELKAIEAATKEVLAIQDLLDSFEENLTRRGALVPSPDKPSERSQPE